MFFHSDSNSDFPKVHFLIPGMAAGGQYNKLAWEVLLWLGSFLLKFQMKANLLKDSRVSTFLSRHTGIPYLKKSEKTIYWWIMLLNCYKAIGWCWIYLICFFIQNKFRKWAFGQNYKQLQIWMLHHFLSHLFEFIVKNITYYNVKYKANEINK